TAGIDVYFWGRSRSRALGALAAGGLENRCAGIVGLEDDEVPGATQDLANEPLRGAVGNLHHDRAVGMFLNDVSLLAKPACTLGRNPDPGDPGRADLAPREPLLLAEAGVEALAGLELLLGDLRLLDPVKA